MTTESATVSQRRPTAARSIIPCLAFSSQAAEAIHFYVSVFANSRVVSMTRSEPGGPIPPGQVLHATFELAGRPYTAMDGGPSFQFSQGISLVATCETQDEIDAVWQALCQGGEAGPCGWLTDRFGLAWQVVPTALGEMLGNPAGGNAGKVMEALLGMSKIDIATLERAYAQP